MPLRVSDGRTHYIQAERHGSACCRANSLLGKLCYVTC